jgi:ABC-type transporter Mla subunit MlaD
MHGRRRDALVTLTLILLALLLVFAIVWAARR